MSIKQDLRVARTRKFIEQALIRLMLEQPFATLTVQQIADAAMVNRSTFYLHYTDKYDLLEQIHVRTIQAFTSCIDFAQEDQYESILRVIRHVQQHVTIYRSLLTVSAETSDFAEEIRSIFATLGSQQVTTYAGKERFKGAGDYFLRFFASSALTTIRWWIEVSNDTTAEEAARMIRDYSEQGLRNSFEL
ncbi:TetR/AcrR family transcriptional regulator [Paenibacillus sp. WLX1005]|uniref:TetR/AcrR family transcriptional regulator n=1 Tax=unclassified Paenibacillus TaxID=185978 RepID=UPI0039840D6A